MAQTFTRDWHRSPVLIVLWAILVPLWGYLFITKPGWLSALSFAGCTAAFAQEWIYRRNQQRPVLEIRDEEIRYAPSPYARQRRVPLREIDGIQIARWRNATLRLRSGGQMIVNLKRIEGIDRERAASALERAAHSATA